MTTHQGAAPPSNGPRMLTKSEVSELLLGMQDAAISYARIIAGKWNWLRPDVEDLKAGVIELMWEGIIHVYSTEGDVGDITVYLRACVFKQQARLVAHALGFSHEYKLYEWMHKQRSSASYYEGVDPSETIEATDSDIEQSQLKEHLDSIFDKCNMQGKRREIMTLVRGGFRPKQIATRLNMSVQLVCWHKQRGLRQLADYMTRNQMAY